MIVMHNPVHAQEALVVIAVPIVQLNAMLVADTL